jgi:signal transduction histidine kinase
MRAASAETRPAPRPLRGVTRGRDDAPGAPRSHEAEPLPAAAQRAAYRVVQEGLTNARKHAPGAIVDVTVTGTAQAGLVAEIVSRRAQDGAPPSVAAPDARRAPAGPDAAAASVLAPPGPGAGLIGLAERLALVGGDLQHGTNAMGDFVLRATIPGSP